MSGSPDTLLMPYGIMTSRVSGRKMNGMKTAKYSLEPGDLKAVDLDGNESYEAVKDKTFLGYEQPRF